MPTVYAISAPNQSADKLFSVEVGWQIPPGFLPWVRHVRVHVGDLEFSNTFSFAALTGDPLVARRPNTLSTAGFMGHKWIAFLGFQTKSSGVNPNLLWGTQQVWVEDLAPVQCWMVHVMGGANVTVNMAINYELKRVSLVTAARESMLHGGEPIPRGG